MVNEPLRYNTPIANPDGTPTLSFQRLWQNLQAATSGGAVSITFSGDFSASPNPITGTGTVNLTNSGATAGTYTLATVTVDAKGRVTAISSGSSTAGTVTQVNTGTGLTGGPITTTGTVALADTAVAAGGYGSASSVATFTVDAQGRLTAAGSTTIAIAVGQVSGLGTMATETAANYALLAGNPNFTAGLRNAGADTRDLVAAGSLTRGQCRHISANQTINTGLVTDANYYLYNTTGGDLTLTQGPGLTLRRAGTTGTGNRTLLPYGYAWIRPISSTEYTIEGAVL